MPVAFDSASGRTVGFGVTTVTTAAFTIGSGANRAGLIGVTWNTNDQTGITGSIGGTSGSILAGTDSETTQGQRNLCIGVTNPPSGSQTSTVSWTTTATIAMGAIVATGVDQTTSFNNGTFTSALAVTTLALTITSNADDLTSSVAQTTVASAVDSDRTERWGATISNSAEGGDTGPGTGSPTHTWTTASADVVISGANFRVVVAAAGLVSPRLLGLLGVGT